MCFNDGLSCNPGQSCETWQCYGFCEPTCQTGFQVDSAILTFSGNSKSSISSSSFDVSFGVVVLENQHNFQLTAAELKITDGNFTSTGDSTLDFLFGELEVGTGNIFLLDNSKLRTVNGSELEVQEGSIQFDNNAQIVMVASEIELAGGDLIFAGNSTFTSSALPIGSLDGLGSVETDGEMVVTISSGLMLFTGTSTAAFLNRTELEVFGTSSC